MKPFRDKIIVKLKQMIKKVIKHILLTLLPVIAIVVISIIILASFVYFLTIEQGSYKEKDWSNTDYVVSEKILSSVTPDKLEKDENNGGWKFAIDLDKTVEDIIQTLKDNNGVLDQYIKPSKQKEYLKAFIKAELITQYPDLRTKDKIGTKLEENEIQGCIQIHRKNENEAENLVLTYVDYDTFQNEIKQNKPEVKEHFSFTQENQLCIAGWSKITTNQEATQTRIEEIKNQVEYSFHEINIPYQTLVTNYSMPFDFLWAFTVMGEEAEFSYELAKLAINSKIILSIYENVTTHIEETIEEYDWQEKIVTVFTNSSQGEKIEEKEPIHYCTKTTVQSEISTIQADISYADTWIVTYQNEYYNQKSDEQITESTRQIESEEYQLKEEKTKDNAKEKYYARKFNCKITDKNTTFYNQYQRGNPSIIEKTDQQSNTPNFVTLFLQYQEAKKNILSAPEWLYEMLESSEKTVNKVDTVKYLFYKATQKDYGVDQLDLTMFMTSNILSVKSGSAIWNNNMTKEEFCQKVRNYVPPSESYQKGYEKYFIPNVENFYDIATSYGLDPCFIFCIGIHESGFGTSKIAIEKGNFFGWGAYDSSPYESAATFTDLSAGIESVCKGLAKEYIQETGMWHNWIIEKGYDPTTIEGIGVRYASDANWANAVIGHMSQIFQYETQTFFGDFLQIAKSCHDYVRQNQYYYSSRANVQAGKYVDDKGGSIGSKIPKPAKGEGNTIDCSAYVTWVLYEYGYSELEGWQKVVSWFANENTIKKYGWKVYPASQAQAGDVLIKDGHMEIYVGNNRSYNCGSTQAIREETSFCNPNNFTTAIRINKPE